MMSMKSQQCITNMEIVNNNYHYIPWISYTDSNKIAVKEDSNVGRLSGLVALINCFLKDIQAPYTKDLWEVINTSECQKLVLLWDKNNGNTGILSTTLSLQKDTIIKFARFMLLVSKSHLNPIGDYNEVVPNTAYEVIHYLLDTFKSSDSLMIFSTHNFNCAADIKENDTIANIAIHNENINIIPNCTDDQVERYPLKLCEKLVGIKEPNQFTICNATEASFDIIQLNFDIKKSQTYKKRLFDRDCMLKGHHSDRRKKKPRGQNVREISKRRRLDGSAFENALEMATNPSIIYVAKQKH